MMNKKTTSLLLIVLASSLFSAIPVNACQFFGKTSLEVWKVIDEVEVCDDWVTITGTIYIQNDPINKAEIMWVRDSVEAKAKKQPWKTIWGPNYIGSSWFQIEPDEIYELDFSITFPKGDYKTYRNVIEVCLYDTDRGDRFFKHRVDIEI